MGKVIALIVVCVAAYGLGGCAALNPEGFEFGAKLGMYAVDTRKESQETIPQCGGLMGMLRGCQAAPTKEGQAS